MTESFRKKINKQLIGKIFLELGKKIWIFCFAGDFAVVKQGMTTIFMFTPLMYLFNRFQQKEAFFFVILSFFFKKILFKPVISIP